MSITFVDNSTPLNAANMNLLEQTPRKGAANGYAGLDGSQNLPLVAGGKIIWAGDTNLYRSAASFLKTDGNLVAGADLFVGNNSSTQAQLVFGSAADTKLYRNSANFLQTDGSLLVGRQLSVDFGNTGQKIYFGSAADTNVYRSAANTLKTDGWLEVGQEIRVNNGGMQFVQASHTVVIKGIFGAAVAGSVGSITLYVDGVYFKIPYYN